MKLLSRSFQQVREFKTRPSKTSMGNASKMQLKIIRKVLKSYVHQHDSHFVKNMLNSIPFFIKIHPKFMQNHQKTRFGNRLGKRHNFLYIFCTFWYPLGALGSLPGHHFSSKMLRVCWPQALLDAFW